MLEKLLPQLGDERMSGLRDQLEQMISARRLPHAIIIEGENAGLNGKLARLIAHAKLCSCAQPLSGDCTVCRVIAEGGKIPDIVEVQGSGKTGAISVDTVRQLHSYGSLVPELADGIVYLLENGDLMLKPAQNAFLKLFEEPPANVTFIITCTSALKMLETIRSRACLFHAVWPEEEAADDGELRAIAEQLALVLLSPQDADIMMQTARYSRTGKEGTAARKELLAVLGELRAIFRQALVIGAGAEEILPYKSEAAAELSRALSPARTEQLMAELSELERAIKNNANMALLTTAMCVRLRKAAGK